MTASKNISTGLMMAVLTVLCWASYNVAAKSGIDAGMSAETLTFLRFAVPGIIAIPIATKICLRGAPSSASLPRLLVLVCLGGPLFGMAGVSGYAFAPLSHGLLFAPVAVFVSASFLGGLLLKEKMGMSRLMGALIMFAGLAVLVGFQLSGLSQDWWRGAACFIAAGVMWGSYTALIKRWDIPMLEGTALVAAGSAIVAILLFAPEAIKELRVADARMVVVQTLIQGWVGGVISVVALIGALRTLSVQTAALLPILTPAVALFISTIVLGETPELSEIIGIAIIGFGFLASNNILSWRNGDVLTALAKRSG